MNKNRFKTIVLLLLMISMTIKEANMNYSEWMRTSFGLTAMFLTIAAVHNFAKDRREEDDKDNKD